MLATLAMWRQILSLIVKHRKSASDRMSWGSSAGDYSSVSMIDMGQASFRRDKHLESDGLNRIAKSLLVLKLPTRKQQARCFDAPAQDLLNLDRHIELVG